MSEVMRAKRIILEPSLAAEIEASYRRVKTGGA